MKHSGSKFRKIVESSLMAGSLVAIEVDKIELIKFITLDIKNKHIEKLAFSEQKKHAVTKDDYWKFVRL